jgi:hypothetical protein
MKTHASERLIAGVVAVLAACAALPVLTAAETPVARRDAAVGAAGARKGPLPDPALLDGSTLPPEKKNEFGMVGDFELPGDENVRSGRVGGPTSPVAGGGQSPSGQAPSAGSVLPVQQKDGSS